MLQAFPAFFSMLFSGESSNCDRMYLLNFYLGLALAFGPLTLCWTPSAAAHKRGGEQQEVKDKLGAVASESTVCSNVGIDLIKDGGNAADAVCPE